MSDTLITIIAIFLAAILMFIFPLMSVSERNDDIAQSAVQTAVTEFVDKITTVGAIKPSDYDAFIQELSATGNKYDVQMEVQHLDENQGSKPIVTSGDLVGENTKYSTYTTEILNYMYNTSSERPYVLKKGDSVGVTAENENTTIAQSLKSFLYKIIGKDTHPISARAAGPVVNTGASR